MKLEEMDEWQSLPMDMDTLDAAWRGVRMLEARIEALEEALQDYVKWHSYCNASTRYAAPHHHDPMECGECRMRAKAATLLSTTKEDDRER